MRALLEKGSHPQPDSPLPLPRSPAAGKPRGRSFSVGVLCRAGRPAASPRPQQIRSRVRGWRFQERPFSPPAYALHLSPARAAGRCVPDLRPEHGDPSDLRGHRARVRHLQRLPCPAAQAGLAGGPRLDRHHPVHAPGRAAAVLAVRNRPDRQPSRPAYGKSRPESHGRPCGPARQITDGKTGRVHRQGRSPARMALPRQSGFQHHRPLYARRQRPHRAAQRRSRLSGHAQGHQRGQGTGLPVEFHFRLRRSGQELRRRPARRCRTRMRRAPAHGRRGLLPPVAELAQTPRPGRQARLLPAAAPHPAPVFHQPADAPQSPDLRRRNRLHRRHEHFPEPPRQPEAPLTGAGRALPLPRPHRAAA